MSERILQDFPPGELTCRQLAELVSDFLDGVLDPALQAQIRAHLAGCRDCTFYVEQVRTTIALTGKLAGGEVAPPVRAALLELFRGWASAGSG